MLDEQDLRDLETCKKLLRLAFQREETRLVRSLVSKISAVFIFSPEEYRRGIVGYAYSKAERWSLRELMQIGKESVLGNILVIYWFLKRVGVVTTENIEMLAELLSLDHIGDPLIFDYLPTQEALILNLDERVKPLVKVGTIEKAVEVCELFFSSHRLEESRIAVSGILLLYEHSERAEHKFKAQIMSALLQRRMDVVLALLRKIHMNVQDEISVIQNYGPIYELLVGVGVPVYFGFENLVFMLDTFYNQNFYFALYLDKSGKEHLLMPFEQIDASNIQQVFDLETGIFATPKGRMGKISLRSVYSFRKVQEITEVDQKSLEMTKAMSEDEIEERIRAILEDQNITSHSPAERVDVYEHKLFVNNEKDLRDVGVIIEGKGYPKVRLDDVATNILKAMDLPIQIVFLIHTGVLLDEPREKFANQCDRARKMHCVIDVVDLTKILMAYNKIVD